MWRGDEGDCVDVNPGVGVLSVWWISGLVGIPMDEESAEVQWWRDESVDHQGMKCHTE